MRFLARLRRNRPHVPFVPARSVIIRAAALCAVELFGGLRVLFSAITRLASLHVPVRLSYRPCAARLMLDVLLQSRQRTFRARFRNCFCVVIIARLFREMKNVLVRPCTPICYALRHRVRFRPNNVLSEIPPSCLQRERELPRNTDEILRFNLGHGWF